MTTEASRARMARAQALPLLLTVLYAVDAPADVGDAVTLASGLANPRGLAFAPNGDLYVAESGTGGQGNCTFSPPNPANQRCYGETGAISRVLPEGGFERVVTGLPSLGLPDGTAEGGPVDVSFLGTAAIVTMSWGGNPALRAPLGPKGYMFGSLLQTTPGGTCKVLADVAAHEVAANPAGGNVDSNPYSVLAQPGRRIVADAGANALIEVRPNGQTRTFSLIPFLPPVPPIPAPREPVPTSVAEGPDGALYVGELTSFPFWPGTASVVRVASDGSSVETYVPGLTAVVDLAFDAGGALYVLEIARGQVGPFPPPPPPNPGLGIGRLLRVCPGGMPEVLLSGLTFAAGVAIGPDGAAYLTNFSTSSTAGEVLRLAVAPCR
ncbi:MAG TPA: ScyD/ScyE family protein [Steroidobacteraceae bacterium]|nr:ScyD/ScyE family protein [Steroidobacteraceae bacterium]